jgi:hypothetical protein
MGWALLKADGGKWELDDCGVIKPRNVATKALKRAVLHEDIYRAGATALMDVCISHKLSGDDTIAAVERSTFIALNVQTMAIGASISAVANITLWLAAGVPAVAVVPSAWQRFLRAKKGEEGKIAAAKLTDEVYGRFGVSQDICDAIGIAHYLAHHRGLLPWLDDKTRQLEIDVPSKVAYDLGRTGVEASLDILRQSKRNGGAAAKDWEVRLGAYWDALRNYRKMAGLAPQTHAVIEPFEKAGAPI